MSFLSQLFILSPRGDTIIRRDYRHDVPNSAAETFFRKIKFWGSDSLVKTAGTSAGIGTEEAPPIFSVEGVHYVHIKSGGLLLCGCTRLNIVPSLVIELLQVCLLYLMLPIHWLHFDSLSWFRTHVSSCFVMFLTIVI